MELPVDQRGSQAKHSSKQTVLLAQKLLWWTAHWNAWLSWPTSTSTLMISLLSLFMEGFHPYGPTYGHCGHGNATFLVFFELGCLEWEWDFTYLYIFLFPQPASDRIETSYACSKFAKQTLCERRSGVLFPYHQQFDFRLYSAVISTWQRNSLLETSSYPKMDRLQRLASHLRAQPVSASEAEDVVWHGELGRDAKRKKLFQQQLESFDILVQLWQVLKNFIGHSLRTLRFSHMLDLKLSVWYSLLHNAEQVCFVLEEVCFFLFLFPTAETSRNRSSFFRRLRRRVCCFQRAVNDCCHQSGDWRRDCSSARWDCGRCRASVWDEQKKKEHGSKWWKDVFSTMVWINKKLMLRDS